MSITSVNNLYGAERQQFLMNMISINTQQIDADHEDRQKEIDEINQDVYSN
jgi:hypothetical protein